MKKPLALLFLVAAVAFFSILIETRSAPPPTYMTMQGWAWSSNIGWVDLNSVTVNELGYMQGLSWSPNIGWIKYDGLSDYPSSIGAAHVNLTTGEVKGWIRACAGTVSGDCSSMTSRSDGWDGWIELAGSNHASVVNSGVTPVMTGLRWDPTTGLFAGMAWGGEVVGWLNFSANTTLTNTSNLTVSCSGTDLNNGTMRFTATASGGTTSNYEYSWDNGAWTSATTFNKSYPSGSTAPVTTPLKAREVGNTYEASTMCSATPNTVPTIPSPYCTINDQTNPVNLVVTESATFKVPTPLPADTYRYYWDTGVGAGSVTNVPTKTQAYNAVLPTYNTSVRITSLTNGATNLYTCPSVTVSEPTLDLYIGPAGSDSVTGTEDRLKKSFNFKLQWTNTLVPKYNFATKPDGYNCLRYINDVEEANWGGEWGEDISESGSSDGMHTTNVETGKYTFKIQCTSTGGYPPKESSVILHVVDPTDSEI